MIKNICKAIVYLSSAVYLLCCVRTHDAHLSPGPRINLAIAERMIIPVLGEITPGFVLAAHLKLRRRIHLLNNTALAAARCTSQTEI